MSSMKKASIIAATAGAFALSSASANAAPALPLDIAAGTSGNIVLADHPDRHGRGGPVFDLRDLFPNLDRRNDRRLDRRLISQRRAAQITNAHTPMRIRRIARNGRIFEVRGLSPRHGRVEVSVDSRTARVIKVERLGRDRASRVRLIGALKAGEIAREHVRMRVRSVSRDGNIYDVKGFNRRRGEILVRVDGRNGRVLEALTDNNGPIGRSRITIDNGGSFRTNRSGAPDYRDVGQ